MSFLANRSLRAFDYCSFIIMLILSSVGLLFVFSTTYQVGDPYSLFFKKQVVGSVFGYILCILTMCIDYRRLQRWGYFLYFFTIALLVYTLIKGSIGLGAQRWINVVFFKFQPSELLKIFFPAFFTYYFLEDAVDASFVKIIVPNLVILCVSLMLVVKQPDLGTAIIIGISNLVLLAHMNISRYFFYGLLGIFLISAPVTWRLLKPYQKQRVLVFLGQGDLRKERYQIEQSRIAIGSGGLFGKGLLQGTQNILQFLPESRTDFIFSIISEELGFVGACSVIILYVILFLRWIGCIALLQDRNAYFLAWALIAPIIIATLVNMGMVTGLLPIVGIPLPFISYGITHSWITMVSIGFLNSIFLHQLP
jgi:rod shape determining protein RodA